MHLKAHNQSGFTLIEMAIVLVIVGLLVSAFLTPLTAQRDLKDYTTARSDLVLIQEALYGFAVVNGRLPCPDTTGDGVDDACGGSTSNTATTGGNIPWVTLGLTGLDPWNRRYQYRIHDAFNGTFSLTTSGTGAGILRVCTDTACGTTDASNIPAIIYTMGKNGAIAPTAGTAEAENTDGDRDFVMQDFSPTFDDVVVWVSPNILFNRMVVAGRLP
jgi:prepilin-type N-terminal cleavage/methylation domain-containing protein